jgi:lysylphosphatidylglycerol synthetase-like protein (DUF2156 family)
MQLMLLFAGIMLVVSIVVAQIHFPHQLQVEIVKLNVELIQPLLVVMFQIKIHGVCI